MVAIFKKAFFAPVFCIGNDSRSRLHWAYDSRKDFQCSIDGNCDDRNGSSGNNYRHWTDGGKEDLLMMMVVVVMMLWQKYVTRIIYGPMFYHSGESRGR